MNKEGFSLFEFFMVTIVLALVIAIGQPLIMLAIKTFRVNAYKNSAYNVLEAVRYYVADNNFSAIPDDGIDINELDLKLKNNNFESGIVKKIGDNKLKIINLKQKNYCAFGTLENMKATDKGCGALDTTKPEKVNVFLKNTTSDSLTILVGAIDKESDIIYYEYSIDNKKYTKKTKLNEYTFDNLKSGSHKIKVRVTNEAGLKLESNVVTFKTNISDIECNEINDKELYQSEKNIKCTYPSGYKYEYSLDNNTWDELKLKNNSYIFKLSDNKTIYTRVIDNDKVIKVNSLNIYNIDSTLNGAYPELLDNMIPVIYDETRSIWIKANPKKLYFDYKNKIWANAVFVKKHADLDDSNSHSRDYYLSNDAIGKEINLNDVVAFYVWIPRYEYKSFNSTSKGINPVTIDINFIDKNKKNKLNMNSVFNDKNGFWVSKYQSSTSLLSNCYSDLNSCDNKDIDIYSLPDRNSISNISISTAYLQASNMNKNNNIYGLDKNTKPHVLTNLEWGAISYLTNSIYGINDNVLSSTTGNITGVFDMSGKKSEMVMANYNKDSGKDSEHNSGFKDYGNIDWPDIIDYYDGITFKNRLLGDALGETINWYNSTSNFVNGENPFFIRGGIMNNVSSIYNYTNHNGTKSELYTYRTAIYSK